MIAALPHTHPALYTDFTSEQRKSTGWTHLLKETGRYPLTARGRLNTYSVFAETARAIIGPLGYSGLVLPTGIATDASTASFFADLVKAKNLVSVYDFENEEKLFQDVNNRPRFCLLVIAGRAIGIRNIQLAFRARRVMQLGTKRFSLTPEEIARINPNTLTCPVFDTPRSAQIVVGIYSRIPVLWRDEPENNPWGLSFMQGIFNMASDSGLFHTSNEDGDVLPLYEAKMVHHFDHRFATYSGATEAQINKGTLPRLSPTDHANSSRYPVPRYWTDRSEVENRLTKRGWDRDWLLGWRDICRSTDERTMISAILPKVAVGGIHLALPKNGSPVCLEAAFNSFVLDYVARQKNAGVHLAFFTIKQLPLLPPSAYDEDWLRSFIESRVLELTYTAGDIESFARDLGDDGPPFRWDEERRFAIRAELDAMFFHLYSIDRDDVDYIMETFPIVKRKDIHQYGTFRTKDLILQIYDSMADATRTGKLYQAILDPPPGYGPRQPTR
jgi:hypothetical protein